MIPSLKAAAASVALATALLMISLWTLVLRGAEAGWQETLAGAIPLGVLFAAVSVAARFPVRALPVDRTPWSRLLAVHGLAAITVAALWGLIGTLWIRALDRFGLFPGAAERLDGRLGPILGFAALGYLLAVSVHSLLALAEDARAAEARALSSLAEAREAELRVLRSQLGPHFLFNTLNTVASLAGREPEAARRACLLLAGILRRTLKSPAPERVPLAEELALVHDLLAVEVLRFGTRLAVLTQIESVDPDRVACSPLVLLPLVENAVTHGVAERLEGGEISISVGREGDAVRLEVANDCDPDRRRRPGTGLGLDLARRRLVAAFGARATLDAIDEGARYRVVLHWPLQELSPAEERVSAGQRVLRVLVVDDEEPARLLLREHLANLPEVEVVGDAGNGFEALRAAAEFAPDVLLLDVRMPKLDGFEVVELLGAGAERPAVIFVTAYEEHALRAFRVHAVDYLLKPVEFERLKEALSRVPGRSPSSEQATALVRATAREARGGSPLDRVVVRDGAAIHVLPVESIDLVEAKDDYVVFHCGKVGHRKQQTLSEVEGQLDPRRFVRVHRSFLVRLDTIARIELYAKDSRIALLRDGRKLPVSRAGYERLRELL